MTVGDVCLVTLCLRGESVVVYQAEEGVLLEEGFCLLDSKTINPPKILIALVLAPEPPLFKIFNFSILRITAHILLPIQVLQIEATLSMPDFIWQILGQEGIHYLHDECGEGLFFVGKVLRLFPTNHFL